MKKILSLFLVVATIFSVMIVPVQAAIDTVETGRYTYYIEKCERCGSEGSFAIYCADVNETYTLYKCCDSCMGEPEVCYSKYPLIGVATEPNGPIVYGLEYDNQTVYIPYGQTYYLVFEEPIQGIITGDLVPNAEYYQLYEKIGTEYVLVRTQGNLEFDLNEVVNEPGHDSPGDYTFVVKACAEGYESSDYSNEVIYTVK